MSEDIRGSILNILEKDSRLSAKDIAAMLGTEEDIVKEKIQEMEKSGIIGGYHTMINWDKYENDERVTA